MSRTLTGILSVCLLALLLASVAPRAVSPDIVISQVYGGGGNAGATLTNDFVELFNRGSVPISVDGWSVQYASSAGTSWQRTNLAGTIPAGGYYLVQQAAGSGGLVPLPTPDAVGTIAMSATSGKLALVANQTTLSGSCPTGLVDFVGFGSNANCFEGSGPTATLSNTTAAHRSLSGCAESDSNATDFSVSPPAPRSSASPPNPCGGPPSLSIGDVAVPEGSSGTTTATFAVTLTAPAPAGGITFDIATEDGTATASSGDYVARALTGETIPAGNQTYTFDVTISGDTVIEPHETFLVKISNVAGAPVADDTAVGTIQNDDTAPPTFDVVISQVYGGGGNQGATLTNDFIELFNRGTTTIALTGWSVQYTSPAGATWQVTPLNGSIAPGRYHLVQQAAGSGGTVNLPVPDTTGSIAMGATSGKVALLASTTALSDSCPSVPAIVDLVGYGSATCFEGLGPAGALANATAALRKRGGCVDSHDNASDFLVGSPAPRNSSTARSCEYLSRAIHEIQGGGLQTPLLGHDVVTTGVVTSRKSNGFFAQTPDGDADADPATSQGIFVFTAVAPAPAVGDAVLIKGTAAEFFGLTQIESTLSGDVTIAASGQPLPLPVTLTPSILDPAGAVTQLERFEGMRVHAAGLRSVAPTNEFGEIHTVLTSVPRPMREPGIEISRPVPPDPVTGFLDCCIPRWDENPERIVIDSDGPLGSAPLWVTSHVGFAAITGPLDFTFGEFKLLPDALAPATPNMTSAPVPERTPNEFTVAGFNIENFTSSNTTQLRKAALAIRTVLRAPDVVGVVEVANLASLSALAAQINADATSAGDDDPAYDGRLIPASPTATQNVGLLVKTSRVRIDGLVQALAGETYPNPLTNQPETLHDRPPLVLQATVLGEGGHGGPIVVVVTHLRSFIDIELLAGEGVRVRAKRQAQAESIAALLQQLQEDHPGTPVMSVGDYNAFEFSDGYTDPLGTVMGTPTPGDQVVVTGSPDLVNPDFVNLTHGLPAPQRYTFVFEGTPQALDHVLVNDVARGLLQRYVVARANADFPRHADAGLSTDPLRPEASSDHDMPVAYFAFPGAPVVTLNGGADITVEAYTSFVDPGATAHDDRGNLPVSVSGSVDVDVPGDYVLSYSATNGFQTATVTRTVHVVDSTPPAIAGLTATPRVLGPPNHRFVDVSLAYGATDASGSTACAVSVNSNEAADAAGDGHTASDWRLVSGTHVQLRAERSGRGAGRVYTLTVTCADAAGNTASASASVIVPK
jgi:predicted extracellular nuclease